MKTHFHTTKITLTEGEAATDTAKDLDDEDPIKTFQSYFSETRGKIQFKSKSKLISKPYSEIGNQNSEPETPPPDCA